MLNIGIIGLGFMGATHLSAWQNAQRAGMTCKVVAVSDARPERRAGDLSEVAGNLARSDTDRLAFDPSETVGYADPLDLLRDERVNAVGICTPTDTHVELALAALKYGKHVLVEKPVSLTIDGAQQLLRAERESKGQVIMPAHCMRFWPAWSWLKARIDAGSFGAVKSATFTRLASRPTWSNFYSQTDRNGGALYDLHVHDADFVRWCFGDPSHVYSLGHVGPDGGVHHIATHYRHGSDSPAKHVLAEGGWDHQNGFDFRMRYVVNFEEATADFDIGRERQLLLCRNGQAEVVTLDPERGYDHEIRYFAQCCQQGRRPSIVNLDDALAVCRLLEAERRSMGSGQVESTDAR
ncbi:MAG: Gfo/Idh/MocA family oxidoreductase [Tepidisphaeraceae bacterium]